MVCKECKACKKFMTNDCAGAAEFNQSCCEETLNKKKNEVDVSGCC